MQYNGVACGFQTMTDVYWAKKRANSLFVYTDNGTNLLVVICFNEICKTVSRLCGLFLIMSNLHVSDSCGPSAVL